jgi:hypothetical protein
MSTTSRQEPLPKQCGKPGWQSIENGSRRTAVYAVHERCRRDEDVCNIRLRKQQENTNQRLKEQAWRITEGAPSEKYSSLGLQQDFADHLQFTEERGDVGYVVGGTRAKGCSRSKKLTRTAVSKEQHECITVGSAQGR